MEDNQAQPTGGDKYIESLMAQFGWSREVALRWRWRGLLTHNMRCKIFELLSKEPGREMYLAEIAQALDKNNERVRQEIVYLVQKRIADKEYRGQYTYYRLRLGMAEQYLQWLQAQQERDKQPLHFQLFELLTECCEMNYSQIAGKLGISWWKAEEVATFLHKKGFINAKHQKQNDPKYYCRIEPGMTEQYQQWLASQQPDESEP
jgi:predicted ArsR family transcriptional regulator